MTSPFTPPKKGQLTRLEQNVSAVHAHVYDVSYPQILLRHADGRMTETEMADLLGVDSATFTLWRDTIPDFQRAVRTLNTARLAYIEKRAYEAALGEGDTPFIGSERLLVKILEAEAPDRFATSRVLQKTTHEINSKSGLSKLLEGISSKSLDDHFSSVDYSMPNVAATQLVAELVDALPEGYRQALRQFIALGLPDLPPAHLSFEDLPLNDPERLIATANGQWLMQQGVDPVRAVSGGAVTLEAAPIIDNGEDFF